MWSVIRGEIDGHAVTGFWIEMLVNHCTRLAKFDYIRSAYHATLLMSCLFWRSLIRYVIRTHRWAGRWRLMICSQLPLICRSIIFGISISRLKFDNFSAFGCPCASTILRLLLLDYSCLFVTIFKLLWGLLLVLGNVSLLLLLMMVIILILSWNGLIVQVKELDFLNTCRGCNWTITGDASTCGSNG